MAGASYIDLTSAYGISESSVFVARNLFVNAVNSCEALKVVFPDIEEIASTQPEKILTEICDPLNGLVDFQARNLAFKLGITQVSEFTKLLKSCYKLFKDNDLALLEINPLVVTTDGRLKIGRAHV